MTLLPILFASVIINNALLAKLEGFPSLNKGVNLKKIIVQGLKTTVVGLISILVTFPISTYLLDPINFTFFEPVVVGLVVLSISILVNRLAIELKIENEEVELNKEFMLINSVVIAGLLVSSVGPSFVEAIVQVVGFTLGHLLIVLALHAMRARLDLPGVPKAFKGIPLLLIVVGMVAMVFLGLKGII